MVHLLAEAAEMRRQEEIAMDAGRPADGAAVEEASDAADRREVAAVLDDRVDPPGIARRGDHRVRVFQARGQRLLAEQVATVPEGRKRHRGARRGDDHVEDDVGLGPVENGIERVADGRPGEPELGGARAGAVDLDVDQSDDRQVVDLAGGFEPRAAHGSAADEHCFDHAVPSPDVPAVLLAAGHRLPLVNVCGNVYEKISKRFRLSMDRRPLLNGARSASEGSKGLDIRDLARHLNVSIGTVSRALNGRSGVHAETRKRVLEAAAELNYAPNQSGRNLRKGRTHAIAFLLQPHPGDHEYGEPIFMPFLKGVQAVFAGHGLDLIAVMDDPGEAQERLHRIVEARWADAVILAWTRRIDPRIDYLTKVGFPFATFGRSRSGGNSYPSIDFDFVTAGGEAVDRLVGLGHERIALVSPPPGLNFAQLFRQGYRNGLKRNGLVHDPSLVQTGEVNEAGGYAATKALMERRDAPSAIIFNNDAMALGGCRALGDLGLEPGARRRP